MPNWYWEKKELRATPSQEMGMDFDTETRYRREGVRFILELGKEMKLSHNTMATGAVYYHRFYMFHSFQDFNRYVVSTCCLFLAGKAEETPKKCRDIVKVVRQLTNDRQFEAFGTDPREELMVLERVLLQTIKFDLQVEHPYNSILSYAKSFKGDQQKLNKMVQMSWTFVNDSLCTTLCLQFEPEIIAIAVMYLAIKLSKFEIKDWVNRQPHHVNWWHQFVEDLETSDLEEICHQVLDLYSQKGTPTREATVTPPPGLAPRVQPQPKPKPPPQPKKVPVPSKNYPPPMPPGPPPMGNMPRPPPPQMPISPAPPTGPPGPPGPPPTGYPPQMPPHLMSGPPPHPQGYPPQGQHPYGQPPPGGHYGMRMPTYGPPPTYHRGHPPRY